MTTTESSKTDQDQHEPINLRYIFGIFVSILVIVAAFMIASLFVPGIVRAGNPWGRMLYLSPLLLLFSTPLLNRYMFQSFKFDTAALIQFLILATTIFSFYAFGWPKEFKLPEMRHAFSELSVILVLFLLAELAASLMVASHRIALQLEHTADAAVSRIQEGTKPIADQLQTLTTRLQADKIAESVTILAAVSRIGRVASVLTNRDAQQNFLEHLSMYGQGWAKFLQAADGRTGLHDKLRFECCQRFFKTYIEAELKDIGYEPKTESRVRQSLRIASDDNLYLATLKEMLNALDEAGNNVFVRVMTNASPYDFYHWGESYGHLGRHEFMDKFRLSVADLVRKEKTYERIFLISPQLSSAEVLPESESGLALSASGVIADLDDEVLLLARVKGAEAALDDEPQPISLWRDLGVLDVMTQKKRATASSSNRFYGIVPKSVCSARGWEMGRDNDVPMTGRIGDLVVHPVPFLKHFERTYQSVNGMFFMTVERRDELDPLPVKNPDYLILGTRNGDAYEALLVVSSNLIPNSDTMNMELFTAQDDLDLIQRFWERTKRTRKSPADFISDVQRKRTPPPAG